MAVTNEAPESQSSFMDRWFGWMKASSKEEPTETEPSQPALEDVDTTGDQQDKSLGDRILGWFRSTPESVDESKIVADVYEPAPLPPVIHDETQTPSDENGKDDRASQETRPWYARLGSIFSSSTDSAIEQDQDDTVIAEESVEDSDEEALAWVERFGSWSREKISDSRAQEQPAPLTVTSSENLQPKSAEPPQVQALGKEERAAPEKDVVHEGSQNLIADRLGDVSRPDEVWKDLDQDDYCPDDDEDVDEDLDEDIQQGSFSPFLSTRQPTKTRSGSSYFRPAE